MAPRQGGWLVAGLGWADSGCRARAAAARLVAATSEESWRDIAALDGPDELGLGGGRVPADRAEGVRLVGVRDGRVVFEVGSGRYRFRVAR